MEWNEEWDSKDAGRVANCLFSFEQALISFRSVNILSSDDKKAVMKCERVIHGKAQQVITDGVGMIINDARASLNAIQQATDEASNAVRNINSVKKALDIAAAVTKIAVSAASKDPGGVLAGIGQLAGELEEIAPA